VQPLASWREGDAKRAILAFIDRVTEPDSSAYVPPAARIAVFDNDGTLWCERPTYPQALFLMERVRAQVVADPSLAAMPVMRAVTVGDLRTAVADGLEPLAEVILRAHAGLTPAEYTAEVVAWFARAAHPTRGVAFGRLVYQPMLELLDLLRAAKFRVFIVTGGGVEFVRAVSADLYGIPPDDVVGSSVELAVERRDGRLELVRKAAFRGPPNEGEPKPVNIQAHIGLRPIFAAGNSAGDREMLEYASAGPLTALSIVIDHDDDEREYAYGGASFTDPGAEPVLASAVRLGWTIVSMRRDWATVFPS
jgi:phosphoglycolate phosphatase-like HAD superfamily hydrolase